MFRPLMLVAMILSLSPQSKGWDDPKPKVIPATEARDHINEPCIVEMIVRASKNAEKRKEFYLDSEAEFRDPKNVAVVIGHDALDAFKKAGIDDPSTHYRDKTLRVHGTPRREGEQVRIRVNDPRKIIIVESK